MLAMEFQPLDFFILGGLILLAGIGLFRGLSGELGSLVGFGAAVMAGFCLVGVARACAVSLGLKDYAAPASYVIDFVFALIAFGLARMVVSKFVSILVPQPTNAFLGMLGGLLKGVVVVGLLTGVGFLPPGTYSTGFFAMHSSVVREVAAFADAFIVEDSVP